MADIGQVCRCSVFVIEIYHPFETNVLAVLGVVTSRSFLFLFFLINT